MFAVHPHKSIRIEPQDNGMYSVYVQQVHSTFVRYAAVEAAEYNWLGQPREFRFVDPDRAAWYELKTAKKLAKMAKKSARLVPLGVGQEVGILGR